MIKDFNEERTSAKMYVGELIDRGLSWNTIPENIEQSIDPFWVKREYNDKIGYWPHTKNNFRIIKSFLDSFKWTSLIDVGCGSGATLSVLQSIYPHRKLSGLRKKSMYYCDDQKYFDKIYEPRDWKKWLTWMRYDVILLSWPPYSKPFGAEVLKMIKEGTYVIYIGEEEGGCTGDDEMFQIIETQFDVVRDRDPNWKSFEYIHDNIMLLKKREGANS